jgi:CDP-4-dehydro-6-deoxyglucose reductase, E3
MPQGVRIDLSGHASVLDAALAAGAAVPFSCRRGACGSCAAERIAGDCAPAASAMAETVDPGPGRVLMCQVRARGDLTLRIPDWTPAALPERRSMRVIAREAVAEDVVRILLDPGLPLRTHAGQHLRLSLADGDHRCYSIANRRVDERDPIELQVRKVLGGRFSHQALDALKPGDVLDAEVPFGAPAVPTPGVPLVLLATGTGYAGVRTLLQDALASADVPSVSLYWGMRDAGDHYAHAELDAWAASDPRLRWTALTSRVTKGHPQGDDTLQRHVQDQALADGGDWKQARVHACGAPAMLRDAHRALLAAGLPAAHWHADAFVPSGRSGAPHDWERAGPHFDPAGIRAARDRSIAAVQHIAARLRPGMTSDEARDAADQWLRELGSQRTWHPTIVRFGDDTVCTSLDRGDPSRRLREDDVFFIDIGPVWDGYEGDYGDTFVLGADPTHERCAAAARDVFEQARRAWLAGASGQALYDLAESAAQGHGCTLVREAPGHRVADFPHALYGRFPLSKADFTPSEGLWVLEIQLRDVDRPVGAFFEDVLLRDR